MSTTFYTNVQKYGNNILYRGYKKGVPVSEKIKFKPELFEEVTLDRGCGLVTLMGKPLKRHVFDDMKECDNFVKEFGDIEGFKIHGNTNYTAQIINKLFPGNIEYDDETINITKFDIEVDTTEGYPDIEEADKEISSVTYRTNKSEFIHAFGIKKYGTYDPQKCELDDVDKDCIIYHECDDEEHLLRSFIKLWTERFPDVITGWNSKFFDIPYIIKRIYKILGAEYAKRLSPWGIEPSIRTTKMFGREQTSFDIYGISGIDYMDIFKKFGYKYGTLETYKLDHVGYVVLGKKKLSYEEYGSLANLLKENYQKYIDYNIRDTMLIEDLEAETGMMKLMFSMAYRAGVNYQVTLGTTEIWDCILYRKLSEMGMVPFMKEDGIKEKAHFAGGFVKDPIPGLYKCVASFDLNSLYPHLMMQYNMSPETYIEGRHEPATQEKILAGEYRNTNKDIAVAANGVCFRKDKRGIIPTIIESYYAERKEIQKELKEVEKEKEEISVKLNDDSVSSSEKEEAKERKKNLDSREVSLFNGQMAIKILMNALFGATGNRHFRYYINEVAEAITTSGQLSVKWVSRDINLYLNKVLGTKDVDYTVYIDTDSNYFNLEPLVNKLAPQGLDRDKLENLLDRICEEKISPQIVKSYENLAETLSVYENKMVMKREAIADKALFVKKKKYAMNVLNNEGVHYETPKIKVTGLEVVRSSTPEVCREKLKESIRIIMNEGETALQDYIAKFREEFSELSPEQIAKPSGTDEFDKWINKKEIYKKGTPIHVRGSLMYNWFLSEKELDKSHEYIVAGDKIKFLYLRLPNPIRENVISFPGFLPKEMGLHDYIDYDLQFEKVFVKPITNIIDLLHWEHKKKSTIEDLF